MKWERNFSLHRNGTIQNVPCCSLSLYLDSDFLLSFLGRSLSLTPLTLLPFRRERTHFLRPFNNMQVMHKRIERFRNIKKASGGNVNDKVSVSVHYRALFVAYRSRSNQFSIYKNTQFLYDMLLVWGEEAEPMEGNKR
jgi:hypothetical protein